MQNPTYKVNFVENQPDETNNCIMLKHFKTDTADFMERRCFHDIVNFYYHNDEFADCYILEVVRLDEYTKAETQASYIVGAIESDYIYYGGHKFYAKDFPTLATIIHNRNIERDLGVLE